MHRTHRPSTRHARPLLSALALLLAALLLGARPAAAFGDRIRSVHPPSLPPFPSGFYVDWSPLNDQIFFTAPDGAGGYSLWRSDGAPAGAALVKGFPAGEGYGRPYLFGPLGKLMLLTVTVGGAEQLWRSDGTAAGTAPLAGAARVYGRARNLGDTLLYVGESGGDVELWRTDGTDAGTGRVKDINPAGSGLNSPWNPPMFDVLGPYVYFQANDGVHGYELWRSDGTAAGTTLVRDLKPGPEPVGGLRTVGVIGGRLVFEASGAGLWATDGTAAGTVQLFAGYIAMHEAGVEMGGSLYFTAYTDDYQTELWRTDGTAAGTRLVKDINPGGGTNGGSWPQELTVVGDELYFTTCDKNSSREEIFNTTQAGLWKSDGTAAGTVVVHRDFIPLCQRITVWLRGVSDTLFYLRDTGLYARQAGGPEVRIKGSATGEQARPIEAVVGNVALFSVVTAAPGGTQSVSLWRSDGTPAGTSLVQAGLDVREALELGDRLFFVAASEPGGPRQIYAAAPADLLSARAGVSRDGGGTLSSLDGRVSLAFEPGSAAGDLTVELRPLPAPGQPTGDRRPLQSFTLEAVDGAGAPVRSFLKPFTLTVRYADADLGGLPEAGLNLAYWDGAAWRPLLPCAGCGLDTAANTLTARLDHFTEFALLASPRSFVNLPLLRR